MQPWKGQMDISLAGSHCFTPTIGTTYQAARNGLL